MQPGGQKYDFPAVYFWQHFCYNVAGSLDEGGRLMCGIVGYIGTRQAAPILLDGLSKLEYRGYDSAGIAVYDGEKFEMIKSKGRLKVLSELTHDGETLHGTLGIGHTRWATHGSPSDTNAHPHYNKEQSIVVVHNGIIENYMKLKKKKKEWKH